MMTLNFIVDCTLISGQIRHHLLVMAMHINSSVMDMETVMDMDCCLVTRTFVLGQNGV